jgi:predicted secreted protein
VVAKIKLVETQAIAESNAIIKTAEAESAAIAQGAEGRGLALFFDALNVTDLRSKARWQRYLAIQRKN